jgi:Tfp pilus assembly protein PilN
MRAVNLIPPEERRGAGMRARAGLVSYLLVGALVATLAGVTALVLTNREVSERQAEIAQLEQEEATARERAESLRAFADFRTVQESRTATVTSLAQSRFDWERVMRELSLILPEDVWLVELTGTVTPDVQVENGAEVEVRASVQGPALEIVGCTTGQEAVGRFVAALRDIDGVTRVTAAKSERPDQGSVTDASTAAAESSEDECRTRDFITQFEIVAAFDEVQVDPTTQSLVPPVDATERGREAVDYIPGA